MSGSESDDSIKAIKASALKSKLVLQKLTEEQISKLESYQILTIDKTFTPESTLTEEEKKEYLSREWFVVKGEKAPKDFFGHQTFLQKEVLSKQIYKCATDCKIATLTYRNYQHALSHIRQEKYSKINGFLRSIPIFQFYTSKNLIKFQNCLTKVNTIRGQVIYEEGSEPTDVYITIDGEFSVRKRVEQRHESTMAQMRAMIGPEKQFIKSKLKA